MSPTISTVLFDMDGVLVDVSRSYRRAIEETVLNFTGTRVSKSVIQRYKNAGGFNDDWTLTHTIVSDMGKKVSLSEIIEVFQRHYRGKQWNGLINDESPLIASSTLDRLRQEGIHMGVVTGRPGAEARWTLARMGWINHFPLLIAREQCGSRGKPDPFPLQYALHSLETAGHNVSADQSLYLGDTVDDMVAARAAGMWAVGVVPPYLDVAAHSQRLTACGAHLVVDSPNRLSTLLADQTTKLS